jgi:hypothetical protein
MWSGTGGDQAQANDQPLNARHAITTRTMTAAQPSSRFQSIAPSDQPNEPGSGPKSQKRP